MMSGPENVTGGHAIVRKERQAKKEAAWGREWKQRQKERQQSERNQKTDQNRLSPSLWSPHLDDRLAAHFGTGSTKDFC